jgi:ATP-dependent Lon protease
MAEVKFGYLDKAGDWHAVTTLEEDEYPRYYHQRQSEGGENDNSSDSSVSESEALTPPLDATPKPEPVFEGHREFQENQRGVSYETLLLPYLRGATEITIVDPYIRLPHQGRNLVDLLGLLASAKDPADEISVTLVTKEDTGEFQRQHLLMLKDIQDGAASVGIRFNVEWDASIHDRSIRADNGWKILLGRGLDIFQKGSGSQFDIGARRQEFRQVVAFGVTYISETSPEAS